MSVVPKIEARDLRPSRIVAEALVNRDDPKQIADRARRLGYSRGLTNVVVAACCRASQEAKAVINPGVDQAQGKESFQS